MLFGGRKESFPQLRLVSAGLDHPAQPTPFLIFISAVCGVAFATDFCIARLRRRSSFSHGRPSGNVRGSNANALDPVRLSTDGLPHPFARNIPAVGKEETAGMSPCEKYQQIK